MFCFQSQMSCCVHSCAILRNVPKMTCHSAVMQGRGIDPKRYPSYLVPDPSTSDPQPWPDLAWLSGAVSQLGMDSRIFHPLASLHQGTFILHDSTTPAHDLTHTSLKHLLEVHYHQLLSLSLSLSQSGLWVHHRRPPCLVRNLALQPSYNKVG